jgi:tRNA/tmRNA/rRNA uracil-C5-methylase (TrmA/RlmC/RlmD family)
MQETFIKSLDMDARGVGHMENEDGSQGKVYFVEGALPGETVSFTSFKKKKNWEAGRMDHAAPRRRRCASSRSACISRCAAAARCSTWSRRRRWR